MNTYTCYFCNREMEFFSGLLLPMGYINGDRTRVFACLRCVKKHDD